MLSLTELALLGAASYRGTQLAVWDTITQGARDRIEAWHVTKPESKPRKFFHDLIGCPYCAGAWISLAALLAYLGCTSRLDQPVLLLGLQWFAVAGVQALANRWDDSRTAS